MKTRYFKMFSGMFDAVNLRGISKHPTLPISSHRIMVPASLPKFIANLHVFFRERIPIVVLNLLIEAKIPGRAIQVSGNNIPAESAFGQMIQGRGPPGKRIGMFIGHSAGYPEAEMFRDRRHS